MIVKSWKVEIKDRGVKLVSFLKNCLGDEYSLKKLKQWIDSNHCIVNGKIERFSSHLLGGGEQIEFTIPDQIPSSKKALFIQDRILFEDAYILIYNKPSGIISDDPHFLRELKRSLPFLELMHRLDKETSGALVFAKTKETAEKIKELFKKRAVLKIYHAIVEGVPKKQKGKIDNYLAIIKKYQGQAIWGESKNSKALHAITEWNIEKKGKNASLVKCSPFTGRTHQIRVHLSGIGHPILGDYQYGHEFICPYKPSRVLLHASFISFRHPITDVVVEVESFFPEDFQVALQKLFGEKR